MLSFELAAGATVTKDLLSLIRVDGHTMKSIYATAADHQGMVSLVNYSYNLTSPSVISKNGIGTENNDSIVISKPNGEFTSVYSFKSNLSVSTVIRIY